MVSMKASRRYRKAINEMRALADVPWPARRFKYPPTMAPAVVGRCARPVEVRWERRGRILGYVRKPLAAPVSCGGDLELVPFKGYVECASCKWRAKRHRQELRVSNPPMTAALAFRNARSSASGFASRIFRRKSG